MWTRDISQQELHWRVAQFIESYGSEMQSIAYLNRMVQMCYRTKQYCVDGDYFLTWAFFDPEHEAYFLRGDVGVYSIPGIQWQSGKRLWILESNLTGNKILDAVNVLSPLARGDKYCRMLIHRAGGVRVRALPLRG